MPGDADSGWGFAGNSKGYTITEPVVVEGLLWQGSKKEAKRGFPSYTRCPVRGLSATGNDEAKKRVAAYCRVSSGSEEQMGSLNAQTSYYEKYKEHPDYIFAGIYADEVSPAPT